MSVASLLADILNITTNLNYRQLGIAIQKLQLLPRIEHK